MSDNGNGSATAPNACKPYDGDIHCEDDDCEKITEWKVQFHTGGAEYFHVFACDDHVEDYWGYHPEDATGKEPTFPNHWDADKLVSHARYADHIAENCRPDNPHQHGFRLQAFYARKRAREELA